MMKGVWVGTAGVALGSGEAVTAGALVAEGSGEGGTAVGWLVEAAGTHPAVRMIKHRPMRIAFMVQTVQASSLLESVNR